MAVSNLTADRDEAFNTRLGSMRVGRWPWSAFSQYRVSRQIALVPLISEAGLDTPTAVVRLRRRAFRGTARRSNAAVAR